MIGSFACLKSGAVFTLFCEVEFLTRRTSYVARVYLFSRMLVVPWVVLISCLISWTNATYRLLFTTNKDIRVVSLGNHRPRAQQDVIKLVQDMEGCAAVDYLYDDGLVCWTNGGLESIQCVPFNGSMTSAPPSSSIQRVVTTELVSPDGLAADWYTRKLYWADSEMNRVEVVSLDGRHRRVLFWEDIDQPRAIALVPMRGIMFWTDWGEVPKIERAGMNGDPLTRQVIVSDKIFWPNGLTVDYDRERLYWQDGMLKFIASMNYDGSNRKIILSRKDLLPYPFAITYFNYSVFWTDWKTWDILQLAEGVQEPQQLLHSDQTPLYIQVWDRSRQPRGNSPCQNANGNCSHLCLLSPDPPGYTCACPTGVRLLNATTCADGPQDVLLVVQHNDISKLSLDTPDYSVSVLPLHGIKHGIAIDFDPVEGYLYWTDDEAHALRRALLNGTSQQDLVTTELRHPDGIAIDWIARNFYWTDTGMDRIEVARLTGEYRKVLISENLAEPRAIALAPEQGWMFWSDWETNKARIERAALDGTGRRILVNESLGWPNGIALDIAQGRLYWCDAQTDKLEVVSFDGRDRREVLSDGLPHVFGLSLLGDYLYWTDWQKRTVERAHKLTGNLRSVIAEQIPNIMGLKVVRLGYAPGNNSCSVNNGGCSHLCLNRPDTYVCACQIGYELTADEKNCVIPEAFLLYTRRENIGRISIENSKNDATIPITGVKDASSLDFDINDNRIYWTDVRLKAISRAFMNGSDVQRVVELGLNLPEGMAVDWVARNIYWTDSGSKRIEVARTNGSCRKVLIWQGLDEPRSIVLDPHEGYMYWCDWGSGGRIERAAMDGSERNILLPKTGRARGLTIDYAARQLYWAESSSSPAIWAASTDGRRRRELVTKGLHLPCGLTQYQNFVYWSDMKTGNIECVDKNTGQNRTLVHEHLNGTTDLLVYHTSRQEGRNQCTQNSSCSHLCLAIPAANGALVLGVNHSTNSHGLPASNHQLASFHCGCPTHYTLSSDNLTCNEPRSFLIYSQKNLLTRLVPDTSDCPTTVLPIQGLKNIRAIEYDPVSHFFYWVEGRTQSIKRVHNNGTQAGVLIPSGTRHSPFDLAVDSYRRLLFWSCMKANTINVSRLENGSEVGVVVKGAEEKPRNIALYPEKGLLFWADVGLRQVIRAQMDGNQRIIIAQEESDQILALAIDYDDDLIFWVVQQHVKFAEIDGKNSRRLIDLDQSAQVLRLVVHGSWLYWIDSGKQQVARTRKTDGRKIDVIQGQLPHLSDILAIEYPGEDAIAHHSCSWQNMYGGCSHLCLSDGKGQATCGCPLGLAFLHENDKRTCTRPPDCGDTMFTCADKECIPLYWLCDGNSDCPDKSDELSCPACPSGKFRCRAGTCIDRSLECDGVAHCPDSSDEVHCCSEDGMFRCTSGDKCIKAALRCDGIPHCEDKSDELAPDCPVQLSPDSSKSTYLVSILVTMSVLVMLVLCGYYCWRRVLAANASLDDELGDSAGDPLAPKTLCNVAKPICRVAAQKNGHRLAPKAVARPGPGDTVRMSALNGGSTTTSNSYDRSRITGASSSTTEGVGVVDPRNTAPLMSSSSLIYPRETLNPPPSPATTADSVHRGPCQQQYDDDYWCSSSGASRYRPYRHYRAINQPPPPTPCSTDVCDESDSNYRYCGPPCSEYDSDPFPPPPTPRTHYHSDGVGGIATSCPPSPSSTTGRSSTYFDPLPPPPSPVPSPVGRYDC